MNIESIEKGDAVDDEALDKLVRRKEELASLESALAALPHRAIQPYELDHLFGVLLSGARSQFVATSTLPTSGKCSALTLMLLEKAAEREVDITLYFVGRPEPDFLTSKGDRWRPLRKLSELASTHENFRVSFLRESARTIFECLADDERLVVSNEPFLGVRPSPQLLRQFSGYSLNGKTAVASYANEFLRETILFESASHLPWIE